MSSQRLILAIAMFAALVAMAQCRNQVLGQHKYGDSVVDTKAVRRPAVHGKTAAANYECSPPNGMKVTAIELVDRYGDKSAAAGEIIRGGVDQPFVTVNIKSQIHFGIDHVVKCYAL